MKHLLLVTILVIHTIIHTEDQNSTLAIQQREYHQITQEILNILNSSKKNQNSVTINDHTDLGFFDQGITRRQKINQEKKPYTLLVYIAADNDLRSFASRNIQQMSEVASNTNINIIVHLDIRISSNQKVTRRYFIAGKDSIITVNTGNPKIQSMDSGDPQTAISAIEWAVQDYPAEKYMIIFWNHGSGIVDPAQRRIINPTSLFIFNPETHMFDLDRSIGFLDLIEGKPRIGSIRGICWDDTTHNYLNNQKLHTVLDTACSTLLHQKFELIGFDACLMAMVEIADIIEPYAKFMIASQEVELGAGWNYKTSLMPFLTTAPESKIFARHLVKTYEQTYTNITNDFTLSALDLSLLSELKQNINLIATLLLKCIEQQQNNSVVKAIKLSANPKSCTHFEEPSYIDLYDFYSNIDKNIGLFNIKDSDLTRQIQRVLHQGKSIIGRIVIASSAGKNLAQAKGISIYFPMQSIHPSYRDTLFARTTRWLELLDACR